MIFQKSIAGMLFSLMCVQFLIINVYGAIYFSLPAYPPGTQKQNKRCLNLNIPRLTLVTGSIASSKTGPNSHPAIKTSFQVAFVLTHRLKIKPEANITGELMYSKNQQALRFVHMRETCHMIYASLTKYLMVGSALTFLVGTYKKSPLTTEIALMITLSDDLFDSIHANDNKLRPLEKDILYLETMMRSIDSKMNTFFTTEQKLRDRNEATNESVQYLSVFVIAFLVISALGQLIYIKKYLKDKKLI